MLSLVWAQTEEDAEEEEDDTKEVGVLNCPEPQRDSHVIASLVESWTSLRKCQQGRVIMLKRESLKNQSSQRTCGA